MCLNRWILIATAISGIIIATERTIADPPDTKPNSPLAERLKNAIESAKQARILAEISLLDSAFKAYKEKYGSYPPSDFAKLDDPHSEQYRSLAIHLARSFPRCNVQAEIDAIDKFKVKTPAQAVFLWLAGFSADPEHPISGLVDDPKAARTMPFFEFAKSRLKYPEGKNSIPIFVPENGGDAPYVYFSSARYSKQTPYSAASKQGGKGTVKPYRADNTAEGDANEFVNPKSFQLISAGLDGDFGGGGSIPSGKDFQEGDKDNLTNFSDGPLGAAAKTSSPR